MTAYDGYDWYRIPPELPAEIDFVLCDGPPADGEQIQLARYGLVPTLGDRFTDDVTILLDDAARPGERAVLDLWRREGMRWTPGEASRQFAVVKRAGLNSSRGITRARMRRPPTRGLSRAARVYAARA